MQNSNTASRTTRRGRLVRLFALAAGLGAASFAAPASAAAPPKDVHLVDVLGTDVPLAGGTPTVLIFMSKQAKDASAAFARQIDEQLLDRAVESVGIVDVHRYAGVLRRLATSYLKRAAEDARVRRRERRQAAGVDASPAAVARWHLVGDFDGSLFSRFGVGTEPKQPLAFVVDGAGQLRGPFSDVAPVVAAVTAASAPESAR